jgi:hypothetical protein
MNFKKHKKFNLQKLLIYLNEYLKLALKLNHHHKKPNAHMLLNYAVK